MRNYPIKRWIVTGFLVLWVVSISISLGRDAQSFSSTALPQNSSIPEIKNAGKNEYVAGEVLVKFKGTPSPLFLQNYQLRLKERLPLPHAGELNAVQPLLEEEVYLASFDDGRDPQEVAAQLRDSEYVVYAEPNFLYSLCAIPNDPYFVDQRKVADRIWATSAWDRATEASDVIVAIIDTGIDLSHPDLIPNLWVNPREIPGNGVDDDRNGFVDDMHGWNFVDANSDISEISEHGTKMAGTISARGNNGVGVTGVSWKASLMTIKAGRRQGNDVWIDLGAVVQGLPYAQAMASREGKKLVVNCSFAGDAFSQALYEAMASLGPQTLVTAAAGNGNPGVSLNDKPLYPICFDLPAVLGVGAQDVNRGDVRAEFSNFGSDVDLLAPGMDIFTTFPGGRYDFTSGTSGATALVSGACALLFSTSESVQELKSRVLRSVDKREFLRGQCITEGTLNINRALVRDFNPAEPPVVNVPHNFVRVGEGQPVTLSVSATDPNGLPVSIRWDFGDGESANGSSVTHTFREGLRIYTVLVFVSNDFAQSMNTILVSVTDALTLKIKKKGGGRKLTLTATSSRQNQTSQPTLTLVEAGIPLTFDSQSDAYKLKLKGSGLPAVLTVRSSLGGEVTQAWR
jgi:subtilisin family serine protease